MKGKSDDSTEIKFEVVAKNDEGKSMFDELAFPTIANLDEFKPPKERSIEIARKLEGFGIVVHDVGDFSISASCGQETFESFFSTRLAPTPPPEGALAPDGYALLRPAKDAPLKPPPQQDLAELIEKAYIQDDPIYFGGERAIPPKWADRFRLRVPVDVAQIMRATPVHRLGIAGDGIRVAMADTGFYHHPYFKAQGYNFLAVNAPDTVDHTSDSNGHGTGECANLLAVAPGINFIGVKINNPTLGFKTAVELRPDVITCSWGYGWDGPLPRMPPALMPLYLTVLDAVARGITVVFAAGNGHSAFPGSMPEVISAGGVHVDEDLNYSASKYASGFVSTWFPGRQVPDVCGLCGEPPKADYIVLPVQAGAHSEKVKGTGWGAFSGTSACAPMVAGICALLKQADGDLRPEQIKNLLKYTARDISAGVGAHGAKARPGPDGATGFGLADAERAVNTVF